MKGDVYVTLSCLPFLKLADVQLSLTQTEKSYFESKLKLERVAAESQALLQEKQKLQRDRDELGKQLRQATEEKHQVEERWMQLQSSPPQHRSLCETEHL